MALYLWPTCVIIVVEVLVEKHNDVTGFVLAIVGVIA